MPAYTNAHQHIPEVFKEIMENDAERAALHAKPNMTTADWRRVGELMDRKKRDLVPSAERALRWNTDKGASP